MYSAVYSVKMHDKQITSIVIGSFFHFHGIRRMHRMQKSTKIKKQTGPGTNEEKPRHLIINDNLFTFSHSQGALFDRVRGSRYFVIK